MEKWIKGWGELNNMNIKMSYSDARADYKSVLKSVVYIFLYWVTGTFEDIIKDLKHSFRNKQKKESFIKKLSIKITGFLKKIP